MSADARRPADELIWDGNIQLLEHEQRTLVQPNFDSLSCAFARLVSIGAATSFEVQACGRKSRTSRPSTSTRSPEGSRTAYVRKRGRGSPATTTAGVGS